MTYAHDYTDPAICGLVDNVGFCCVFENFWNISLQANYATKSPMFFLLSEINLDSFTLVISPQSETNSLRPPI
jgi:hypothetical protein